MKVFKNARVYVGSKGVVDTDVAFDDKIIEISKDVCGEEIFLPSGSLVLPGFIDIHIHGAGGADVMDGNTVSLATMSETLAKEGTVGYLATTLTESRENILSALSAVKKYMSDDNVSGAEILGVHLEGPFISSAFKGAQPERYITSPDVNRFDEYNDASGNCIKIVTLAPEADGAETLIKHLTKKGVIPSVAHSSATFTDIEMAVKAGLKQVTHTYNAQSPFHHRDIGVVGGAMLMDELTCELIADTVHVSVPAMKLLVKNKPKGKLILVTDALRAKGLGDGEMIFGGQKVTVKGNQARLENGALAGSVLGMNQAVKNLIEKVGVPLENAVDCATSTPAKVLGLDDELGSIEVGKRADMVVVDSDFNVLYTVRCGRIIYKR